MKDPVAAADQHYRNAHPQDDGKQWHAFVLWFLLTCPTTIMAKLCSGKSPNKLCCNAETGGAIRRAGPALLQAVELDVRAGGDDLGQHLRTAGGRTASLESLGEPLHPGVNETKQAAVIEITTGVEVAGVDIRFNNPPKKYTITGRAADAETGKPVTEVMIWQTVIQSNGRRTNQTVYHPVGANGEFRLDGVKAGKYGISAGGQPGVLTNRYGYSEETIVDIVDEDVTGVEIRVKRGGSLSGIAAIEGATDRAGASNLEGQMIAALQRNGGLGSDHVIMTIDQNGRFQAAGLHPGTWSLRHSPRTQVGGGLMVLRIERDGAPVIDTFEIGPSEQVTGLRMVFGKGTGVIRGRVVISGGTLPEMAYVYVTHHLIGSPRQESMTETGRADARGSVVIDGLVPGQYVLEAKIGFTAPPPPEWVRRRPTAIEIVTISNGQALEVTLTIDLKQ